MGFLSKLFNFNTDNNLKSDSIKYADSSTIPEVEKKYYNPDDYYVETVYDGSSFEHAVIPFEERKRSIEPSGRGLYPPEIVAIYFCSKHPHPKNGYPGYYWFKYGVRDVGALQRSLEKRGFIKRASDGKWEPTELGNQELKDNEFIVWSHRESTKSGIDPWDVRKIIAEYSQKVPNGTWRDVIWAYYNRRTIETAGTIEYRGVQMSMAYFLIEEGRKSNYQQAIRILEEIIAMDKRSGLLSEEEFPNGAPGIVALIDKCKKQLSKI